MQSLPVEIGVSDFILVHMKPTQDLAASLYHVFTTDSNNMRFWLRGEKIDAVDVILDGMKRAYDCENMYMFEILHDNQLIGEIGFAAINNNNKSVNVDYWLVPNVRGQGLINMFLSTIEELAFVDLDMNKVVLGIDVENIASRKVAERCGYTLDGILGAEKLWLDGTIHDECEYSKLKSEWLKEKQNA